MCYVQGPPGRICLSAILCCFVLLLKKVIAVCCFCLVLFFSVALLFQWIAARASSNRLPWFKIYPLFQLVKCLWFVSLQAGLQLQRGFDSGAQPFDRRIQTPQGDPQIYQSSGTVAANTFKQMAMKYKIPLVHLCAPVIWKVSICLAEVSQ